MILCYDNLNAPTMQKMHPSFFPNSFHSKLPVSNHMTWEIIYLREPTQ